jgi:hypothetical protein
VPIYEALAHVLWELPFPLRLPPEIIPVWEPEEQVALFDPRPGVGELVWRRTSTLLDRTSVLPDAGPENNLYPEYDYQLLAHYPSPNGRTIIAKIDRGKAGGFTEPRQYSIANVFLCLRRRSDGAGEGVVRRAAAVVNNLLDVYRFTTLDTLARGLRPDLDTYYTVISVGSLPQLGDVDAATALSAIDRVEFGTELGISCFHLMGTNAFSDLFAPEVIRRELLTIFDDLVREKHELELFHVLMFSAVRRLKRHEHALAIFDAQSALETLVVSILVERLRSSEHRAPAIEKMLAPGGPFLQLQRRLDELDRIARAQASPRQFAGSLQEQRWRATLYRLRNEIAHEGRRDVTFDEAKEALVAGMHAMHAIQDLAPEFNRALAWCGDVLDLPHIFESSGRLARLFES